MIYLHTYSIFVFSNVSETNRYKDPHVKDKTAARQSYL